MTNWLLSSGGRRGALVKILRGTGEDTSRVSVVDNSRLSAAGMLADDFGQVPKVGDPGFCAAVLEYARKFKTDVIVPTIDPEIEVYARNIDLFRSAGIDVWVSSPEVARLGFDKWLLYKWLRQHNFPTMATVEAEDVASIGWVGPSVAKPRNGSSSVGVIYLDSPDELHQRNLTPGYIIQPRVVGAEVTVDFAVDRKGKCLGVVPRRRLETRGGEVSKGVTVYSEEIISLTEAVAEALPGAYGVLNLQLFYDHHSGDLSILEINPRFGGGYPLAHAAGGDLVSALVHSEAAVPPEALHWRPGTIMLRYDESVVFADDRFGVDPWH